MDDEARKYSRRGPVTRAAEERRTYAVSARFTAKERAELEQKCQAAGGMKQGKFLRLAALNILPPAPIPAISSEAMFVLSNIAQQLQFFGEGDVSTRLQPDQIDALKALAELLRDVRCRLIGLPQTPGEVSREG